MYAIRDGGRKLELLHKTKVDGIPGALAPFKGRLLAGIETTVRLYELGKKKLLRKCEHRKCAYCLPSVPSLCPTILKSHTSASLASLNYSSDLLDVIPTNNSMYLVLELKALRH